MKMRYTLTATCPNATTADSFVEYWKAKGYGCYKVERTTYTNDKMHMGAWSVYRTSKKQTT